jgi:gliding motility-associated-like protein
MKKLLLLPVLLLAYLTAYNQSNWSTKFGNIVHEEILDASSDAAGNIITAGYFSGPLTVGATNLSTNGNSDILVIKTDDSGNPIWAVKAGGTGADRAYAVTVDNNGNAYITGYFYNTATFGTITVTGSDRDVFAAKLDPNGNFLWVQTFGGQYGDTGYGIEVDNAGNVVVTGQYKGNGVFGPDNFTSTTDPNTGLPAFDFFLTKLDGAGNFVWTREANAKYDDRGMSVTVDEQNNIYVAGQFSDTITFQAAHNNQSMNAGFLIKYDPLGNEVWFDKYRAAQVILYDVKWSDDQLYLTGDFKGNMQVSHTGGINNYSAGGEFNILVTKTDEAGTLQWFSSNHSENEVTSKQIALDPDNDVYVAGLFKCDFTEMNEVYGNSTFLSMGYRDVHYIKYSNTGTFQWSRQFGSNEDDYCSAIVVNSTDHPVMAGSFENYLVVPTGPSFTSFCSSGGFGTGNCSDSYYGSFCMLQSGGNKDIFICDPFDISRSPLDYYEHLTSCDYDTLVPCILDCQDSIAQCGGTGLSVNLFQIEPAGSETFHPKYDYLWSTGSTTCSTGAGTTGNYSVKISREDGCATYDDTIYVTVNPYPATPLISDNWGYYSNSPSEGYIDTCYADSLIIHAIPGDLASDIAGWDFGVYLNDSTRYIDTSGFYTVTAINAFGCTSFNKYEIVLDDFAIHDTLDPQIHFTNAHLEATDTLYICDGDGTNAFLLDHNYIDPDGDFPFKTSKWYLDGAYLDSIYYFPAPNDLVTLNNLAAGWHTLEAHLVNECGDSVDYFMQRDFYVSITPDPYINLIGPAIYGNYCPGDTVSVYIVTNDSTVTWTGPYFSLSADTIFTVLNLMNQVFTVYVDTITPYVTCSAEASYTLSGYPAPQIGIVDINSNGGIVCPNDSLQLESYDGQAWAWIGPQGDTLATTQTVWVDVPGFYHCIVTDIFGCVLTSNFVEAKEYSSPFLTVDPYFICPGETAEITVVANSLTDITWLAPLSGSSFTITVDTAGTYYCTTSFCNITATDSIMVVESVPVANITAVPSTPICPGDTVTFFANGGMANYWWNGGNEGESIYQATSPGSYVLTTESELGCEATDTLEVTLMSNPSPPASPDTTICQGDDVALFATAADSVYWFTPSGTLLGDTNPLVLIDVTGAMQVVVKNKDSLCFSIGTTVNINMGPTPASNGTIDTTSCTFNAVTLQSGSTDAVTWYDSSWNLIATGPDYTTPILTASAVYYYEIVAAGLCNAVNMVNITVVENDFAPSIVAPALICEGDAVVVASGDSGVTGWSWFDMGGELSDSSLMAVPSAVPGTFTYGLVLELGNCISDTAYFDMTVSPLPNTGISALTPTAICPADSVMIIAATNGNISWSPTYETDSLIAVVNEGEYFYIAELNGCFAVSDTITVSFLPATTYYEYLDTTICEGEELNFNLGTSGAVVWMDADLDTLSTNPDLAAGPLYESTEFYYQVTAAGLCPSPWTPVSVQVIETGYVPDYSGSTALCIGDSTAIWAEATGVTNHYWLSNGDTISVSPWILVYGNTVGIADVQLVTSYAGCSSDTAFISVETYDLPVVNLPNDTTLCNLDELVFDSGFDYTIEWIFTGADTLAAVTFTNAAGCTFTDSIQVFIMDCSLFLPNIFTPDGDGINDLIAFPIEHGEILELVIQNRWGQIMYQGPAGTWDGYDKTGSPCVAGTYFYVIRYSDANETVLHEQGWFFLSR